MGRRASFSCAIHLGPFSRHSRARTLCFEVHTWLTVSSKSAVCKEERKQTPSQVMTVTAFCLERLRETSQRRSNSNLGQRPPSSRSLKCPGFPCRQLPVVWAPRVIWPMGMEMVVLFCSLDRQDFMGPGLVCEDRPRRIEFRTHLETCCLESIKVQMGEIIL